MKRKIVRGGSWKDVAADIRSDIRMWEYQNEQVGEIEEALAALAREKPFNGILISFDCCHIFWPV
mgnify:CR=1 FL=1